jgi:hypothetical protein
MTTAVVCSVYFMWKDKVYAGHAFCVMEDTSHFQHNVKNAQLVIRPSNHSSTHK